MNSPAGPAGAALRVIRRRGLAAVAVLVASLGLAAPVGAAVDVLGYFDSSNGYTGGAVAINATGTGGAAPGDVYTGSEQFSATGQLKRRFGVDVVESGSGNADETQAVRVDATAGTFKLTFSAATTTDLQATATAQQVEDALKALAPIAADGGSVSVTGGPGDAGGTAPYVVAFDGGPRADKDQPQLTVAAGATPLSGGAATATAYTTNRGATGYEVCEPASGDVCKNGLFVSETTGLNGAAPTIRSVVVDQPSGDLFVRSGPEGGGSSTSIIRYSAIGEFLGSFGWDVVKQGPDNGAVPGLEACAPDDVCGIATSPTGAPGGFMSSFGGQQFSQAPPAAPNAGNILLGEGQATTSEFGTGNALAARVSEFTAAGAFVRTFGGGVVDGGATGIGNLVNGSTSVTLAATTSRQFAVGQTIVADAPFTGHLQVGTTITAISSNKLTLSKAATATENAVPLTVAPGVGNAPANERVRVTIAPGVTSGNFRLTFSTPVPSNTSQTVPNPGIPFNATAAQVQAALEGLSNVGPGNVEVTLGPGGDPGGGATPGGPWTIEFKGKYADTNVNALARVSGTPNLSIAEGAGLQIAALAEGASSFEICTAASGDLCRPGVAGADPGQFRGTIDSVAVNDAGDVYAVDSGNRRVQRFAFAGAQNLTPTQFGTNERQSLDVGASTGTFRLTAVKVAGTIGLGKLEGGSTLLTDVRTSTGAFRVGQPMSPLGSARNAVITAVDDVNRTITVSRPSATTSSSGNVIFSNALESTPDLPFNASAGQVEAALNALPAISGAAVLTGDLTNGTATVINIETGGVAFPAGQVITGPGIPAGTTVLSTNETARTLTLSKNATSTVAAAKLTMPPSGPTGSVTVTGGPGGTTPFTIEFDGGRLALSDFPRLKAEASAGTTTVAVASDGGPSAGIVPVGPPSDPSGFDAPASVVVRPDGDVLVAKAFPAGASDCRDGSPSVADQTRIQRYSPDGTTLLETSNPCAQDPRTDEFPRLINPGAMALDPATDEAYLPISESGAGVGSRLYVYGEAGDDPDLALNPIADLSSTGVTVSGTIDPNGLDTQNRPHPSLTLYGVEYREVGAPSWTRWVYGPNVGRGDDPVPFSVGVSGLQPKTDYETRVIAVKPFGFERLVALVPPFETLVGRPRVDSAFADHINASSADLHALVNPGGAATSYHFEYGTTPNYGSSTPPVEIGDGSGFIPVDDHIAGLEPRTYHFRVVATNSEGTAFGPDQTFGFYPESCPNAVARQQTGSNRLPDCRAYELVVPGEMGSVNVTSKGPTSSLATNPSRFAFHVSFGVLPGPWNPPNRLDDLYIATRTNTGWETSFVGIEANIDGGPDHYPPGSIAPVGERGLHLNSNLALDRFLQWGPGNDQTNKSSAPYLFDAESNSLGRLPTNLAELPGGDLPWKAGGFVGDQVFSGDGTHFVYSSPDVAMAPGGLTTGAGSVYDNDIAAGTVSVASKTESGGDISTAAGLFNAGHYLLVPDVSRDGSHILIAAPSACPKGLARVAHCPISPAVLYMRVDGETSYDVSEGFPVTYNGMSADGGVVYFSTAAPMPGTGDSDHSIDLFRWSEETDALTKVSTGPGSVGNVDGCETIWTSGCGVELVPRSVPTGFSGETGKVRTDNPIASASADAYFYSPEQFVGADGVPGRRNLYAARGGQLHYVATFEDGRPITRIQVSSNGRFVAFLTKSRLTEYDNAARLELYRYDDETGGLVCVSCIPDGTLPSFDVEVSENGIFMTDDGRVFFSTTDALVPPDTDGLPDVYEYVDGRPQLLSTGSASGSGEKAGARLVGVSADGTDAYVATLETLVDSDKNGAFRKYYDARVNGGFPVTAQVQPCAAADECHGPSTPAPGPAGIASGVDLGAGGNVRGARKGKCPRGKVRRHGRCLKRKKAKHAKRRHDRIPRRPEEREVKTRRSFVLVLGCALLALAAYLTPVARADQPITDFSIMPLSTQAGGHDDIHIKFDLAEEGLKPIIPCRCNAPRDIIINLPTGWFGVPTNLPHCQASQFAFGECPTDSQIGVAYVDVAWGYVLAIYNMQPAPNQAGLIAIEVPNAGVPPIYTSVTPRTESDYGLESKTAGISRFVELPSVDYILWGVPGDPGHDELRFPFDTPFTSGQGRQRVCEGRAAVIPQLLAGINPWREPDGACTGQVTGFTTPFNGEVSPFISSPTSCATPGLSTIEILAYDEELSYAGSPFPGMTGCDLLSFNPSQSIQPTTTAADSPSGAEFVLDVPQPFSPDAPTASSLKEANVTLPEGFTVAPNLTNGKVACTDEQANIGTRLQAECPESSKIGLISVDTPLLPGPLDGAAWIGEPKGGDRYRLLFTFDGFGFHIKLPGSLILDPGTGQITIRFADLPQAPFSRFTAHFFGAERGSLATPPRCGTFEVKSVFTPWNDALPDQTSTQFFTVDRGPSGGPCPSDPPAFDPAFAAGTSDNTAGGHAPFELDVARRDATQNLSGFELTTPPGFSATLKGIPYCPPAAIELLSDSAHTGAAELASPACGAASRIGDVTAAVGAGTRPLYQNGSLYLAGPYRGAPLSFLTVIPAVSGPYDLGNVAVRAAVRVDPVTARVTTISDSLPQILEGIPLRVRQVRLALDRDGFVLNPTNCDPFSVDASIFGQQGARAERSTHFQVANCADLAYRPRLTIRLSGGTGRRGHPAIHTLLRAGAGEANTRRVSVTLPDGELLDNSHFGAVCTRSAFAADSCPARSRIGRATVHTPLLDQPLSGAAYLRSSVHDLPDIAIYLEGQVPFEVALKVDSVDARLRATVESAPDVPVTSFALHLQGGAKGLLQNSEDLCARPASATVRMTGQNGARHNGRLPLRVACRQKRRVKHDRRGAR